MITNLLKNISKNLKKKITNQNIQKKSTLFLTYKLKQNNIIHYLIKKYNTKIKKKKIINNITYNIHITPL